LNTKYYGSVKGIPIECNTKDVVACRAMATVVRKVYSSLLTKDSDSVCNLYVKEDRPIIQLVVKHYYAKLLVTVIVGTITSDSLNYFDGEYLSLSSNTLDEASKREYREHLLFLLNNRGVSDVI